MQVSRNQISCPNCRQPISVEVQQLFDRNVDPAAKQRLLSGNVNQIQCPFCGYHGTMGAPIVYHDPDKELLLTFVPAELGLPRNEQERLIGSLINRVINQLPQEKRKGYLLNPEATLTFQRLLERILEADGITGEMIQAQQERLSLLRRLMGAAPDVKTEIVKQDGRLLDAEFFSLLGRLVEASLVGGDRDSAGQLRDLQAELLPQTEFGREMQAQVSEIEAAVETLQKAGDGLTREKLLDLIIQAPSEMRQRALVSLTRPALDYSFFQALTDRIDSAQAEEKETLTELRERLLTLTREIDQQVEERMLEAKQLLGGILQSADIEDATLQNLPAIDEFFVENLNSELEAAHRKGDARRQEKLQRVLMALQQASAPPPEIAFIEELLDAKDDMARRKMMEANPEKITDELLDTLAAMVVQAQAGSDKSLIDSLRLVHRLAVRFSMQANLRS